MSDNALMFKTSGTAAVPSVTVVVATRGRPDLLRRTLRSIVRQVYRGPLQIVVVFDQCEVDSLKDIRSELDDRNSVDVVAVPNDRTRGLAGGRNTGIMRATSDLVAFCDDDDEWHEHKLHGQVDLLIGHPEAICVSGAIEIASHTSTTRRTPPSVVRYEDFLSSRVAQIHPSTLLFPRERVIEQVGLVDEQLPFGYGEDYDYLLRLAAIGSIVSVQVPVATIHWDRTSFFASRWQGMAAGLTYLLAKHEQLLTDRRNAARMTGQVAFAHAAASGALEDKAESRRARRAARGWARRSIRYRPAEFRAWAALGIGSGAIPSELVIRTLNRFGRGV